MSDENNTLDTQGFDPSTDTGPGGLMLTEMTEDDMIYYVTKEYLEQVDPDLKYNHPKLKSELLFLTIGYIEYYNKKNKNNKCRKRTTLYPSQIAMIIKKFYRVVRINMGGEETSLDGKYAILAIYQEEGENEGIYVTDDTIINKIISRYNKHISKAERQLVWNALEEDSTVVRRCIDPDLIAVENGIFDYKNKKMLSFSPEYVFIAKCKIPYMPNPTNPVYTNPDDNTTWDVETWMSELFEDDPEIVDTLWQIIGATIRPNVPWNKAAWLLSTRGNNGKGTLCSLIRNLIGHGSYTSIKLKDFSKDFMLEPLTHVTAIITDENDVGTYIDQAANLKAIITGDTIQINRKFQMPVSYQFRGFMIQCVNEVPKIRDRSESFYRRQLIIKFNKSYTGVERKYIKEDYLKRQEVLEYILYRVLHMDYYEITEPQSCKKQMESYKLHNDPVRDFLTDIIPNITVNALPNQYLYDLYDKWLDRNNPAAKKSMLGRRNFLSEVEDLIENFPEWYVPDTQFRVRDFLEGQELTLALYDMTKWMTDEHSEDLNIRYRLKWTRPCMQGILRTEYKDMRSKRGRPNIQTEKQVPDDNTDNTDNNTEDAIADTDTVDTDATEDTENNMPNTDV